MNPITINITFGTAGQQDFSFNSNSIINNRLDTININDNFLEKIQQEIVLKRLNQLITKAINETISTIDFGEKSLTDLSTTKAEKQWLHKVERVVILEMSNSQFTVDSLANILKVSRSKIHRKIKRITGLTPNKYIRSLKLEAARKILEKNEVATVSEVCYAVGFDTPKYFSKIYEQEFGIRPISYIRAS